MSVSGIEGLGALSGLSSVGGAAFTPFVPDRVETGGSGAARVAGPAGPTAAAGTGFGDLVLDGLDRLEGVQRTSDTLAVQAATGDLQSIHDYTIAATQAAVTTQVTVAVRNKAVEAFTEIMRMQV